MKLENTEGLQGARTRRVRKFVFLAGPNLHDVYRQSRLQRHWMEEQPILRGASLQEKKIWCYCKTGDRFWKDLGNPRASF